MKVTVLNHYSQDSKTFEGSEQEVLAQLQKEYPNLNIKAGEPIEDIVEDLNQQQAFDALLTA